MCPPPSELADAGDGKLNWSQKSVQAAVGAAAGQGSYVSVILTAGSGSVTSGTTARASGYFCRRRKTLPVRALNLVFIRLRFQKLYRLCMWVSVTNAGVRSPLSFEVAAGLPPNRFRDRRCSVQPFLLRFGKYVSESLALVFRFVWLMNMNFGNEG